ncbi:hypothetical protein GH714_024588 [Hevea brasiliensis]|uniref:BED-type domain-containing protein n=1 Tax=Hevea brasiliensis TaxID=3981 RepID=A0A6A6KYG9_HEVBR|nr:hypothetical protein GH714_024588 [Hevea brasiliensis]
MESEASTTAKTDNSNKDPAWKYVHLVNPNNRNDVACNFCSKVTKGGIFRAKQHLVGGFRNATMCKKCPTHVREELQEYMQQKASAKTLDKLPDYQDVEILGDNEDEDDVGTILRGSKGNSKVQKKARTKGPIDLYFAKSVAKALNDEQQLRSNISFLAK